MPLTYTITKDDDGSRLHKWMRKSFSTLPLSEIYKSLRKKKVKLNGKRAKGDEVLQEKDEVQLYFDPEKFGSEKVPPQFQSGNNLKVSEKFLEKNLSILFEDDDIIAISKPAGISVHPGSGVDKGKSIIELAAQKFPQHTPHLVHRLDKDTSGVLLLAKHGSALRKLLKSLQNDEFHKEYLALVFGKLPEKKGMIDLPLERQNFGKKIKAGKGKRAVTHYKVQEEFKRAGGHDPLLKEVSLVHVQLETGRTHQIRAHFAAINHPLVQDKQHGDFSKNKVFQKEYGLKRQFLHAYQLSFPHPESGEKITITAPLPKDLKNVLGKLKS